MFYEIADYGDPEAVRRWDEYSSTADLPEPGLSAVFDTFLASRALTREALLRVGARWTSYQGKPAVVYFFPPGWRKYRTVGGNKAVRGSDDGAVWSHLLIVRGPSSDGTRVMIAEGETDAAQLTQIAPDFDVAVLPAGALHFTEAMAAQLAKYATVYIAVDNDDAGNQGAEKISALIPGAQRVLPPDGFKDWCAAASGGAVGSEWKPSPVTRPKVTFSIREVLEADLGTDAQNNWFADGICPVAGEIAIHGPMKSLKSVILIEMLRAITTGTDFAGYIPFIRDSGPGRVLLFQMEIPPQGFQRRMEGVTLTMGASEAELFSNNTFVYGIANKSMPRLKVSQQHFMSLIREAVMESGADVVAFDPIQRLTGGADIDKPNEMQPLFDVFEWLMDSGITVIYTHHNNKASRNDATPYSMSGTQRLGSDADSICSVYHDKAMLPDDNPGGEKQRNMLWTVRNGNPSGRSITSRPSTISPQLMVVHYDDPITAAAAATEQPAAKPTPPII